MYVYMYIYIYIYIQFLIPKNSLPPLLSDPLGHGLAPGQRRAALELLYVYIYIYIYIISIYLSIYLSLSLSLSTFRKGGCSGNRV